jgi:hypothetical protein
VHNKEAIEFMTNMDISQWDVSNCEDFSGLFFGCKFFNGDISSWDVSKGKNFFSMFNGCKVFN